MTEQITPEEDERQEEEQLFQTIKEEIVKINGYQSKPRIDIELITREQARGRKYLDSMFDTIHMISEGTTILPQYTLIGGRLFEKLQDRLDEIRAREQKPEAFSLDFLNIYSWSNCREDYTYLAIFYGGK